ncbi:MAG: hypothetical protein FWH17_01355 [Oscillospiraceae bacterium]|nr:hypothetical protein [Oscillospiraceae bacterium]
MVTRVTNSMLSRTLLSNLSMNLYNMDKLQNQMATGRKYAHISDDPSALIYGQAARNKLARLGHYQQTVETAQSWLTQAEAGIMELQKMVGNVYEELISAGGPKTDDDKKNVAMLVSQLRDHYVDTLNASYGDRFVFAGYNTPGDYTQGQAPTIKPFTFDTDGNLLFNGFNISQFDKMPATFLLRTEGPEADWEADILAMLDEDGNQLYPGGLAEVYSTYNITNGTDDILMFHQLMNDVIHFDVGPGISMPVTMNGMDIVFFTAQDENGNPIMRNMFGLMNEVYDSINGTDVDDPKSADELTKLIKLLQDGQNHLLVKTAEIGGRQRRLELLEARYEQDSLNYESMRSDAEDADMADVIIHLKMAETVYQAALSAGARIIQPSLMDFLR